MNLKQAIYQKELFGLHYEIPLSDLGSFSLQPKYSSEFQKRLLLLYTMTQQLATSKNRKELLEIAMISSCDILKVDRASIAIVDENEHSITLTKLHGVDSQPSKRLRFNLDECAMGTSYLIDAISYRSNIEKGTCPLLKHLYSAGIRSTMICPIICGDVRFGTLNTGSTTLDGYTTDDIHLMAQISAILATHLQNLELREASEKHRKGIEDTNSELKVIASVDSLTQIYNRRHINNVIAHEIEQQSRRKKHLSLIMFDIDRFKQVNDQYGHIVGDEVLCELTALCSRFIRKNDVLGRWGGEEFIISCINTNVKDAKKLAEKIKLKFEQHTTKSGLKITASFGVTEFHKDESKESLIARLDLALYQSKHAGRNCVQAL